MNDFTPLLSIMSHPVSQPMNTTFSLPGIKTIAYCYAQWLESDLELLSLSGVPINISAPLTNIPTSGEPTCECTHTNQNNGSNEKVALSFRSRFLIPSGEYLAFVVIDANDQAYIIGTKEEPHPLVSRTQSFGTPGGDPSTFRYEITHASVKALIPIKLA